jgi:hypothetical protein
VHRTGPMTCRLVLGHQIYDGDLTLGYDAALALRRVFVDGPGVVALVRPGRKISFEQDGKILMLRNGEGPSSTVWQTQMPLDDFHGWLAPFLFLIDYDDWDRQTLPRNRAQLVPMRVQTEWTTGKRPKWADATIGKGKRERSVWRNPPVAESPHQYDAAWAFLQSLGKVPHGAPVQGYDGIVERCCRTGLDPRRLRAVD